MTPDLLLACYSPGTAPSLGCPGHLCLSLPSFLLVNIRPAVGRSLPIIMQDVAVLP